MIKINKITSGRFGNRVLQVLNGLQIAKKLSLPLYCVSWPAMSVFNELENLKFRESNINIKKDYQLSISDIKKNNFWEHLKNLSKEKNLVIPGVGRNLMIHNVFLDLLDSDPSKLLTLKDEFKTCLDDSKFNVGIHIRGDDVASKSPRESTAHLTDYYKRAIKATVNNFDNLKFYICTDDINWKVFKNVRNYLTEEKLSWSLGEATLSPVDNWSRNVSHISDFSLLTECDMLISSSSTYCICAAVLGKSKKVIHSKKWIDRNIPGDSYYRWGNYTDEYPEKHWREVDEFWINLPKNKSIFYNVWDLI